WLRAASNIAAGARYPAWFDPVGYGCYYQCAGWSSPVARWAHNPKVAGSNPAPATNQINVLDLISCSDRLPISPNKKNHGQALAFTGLNTISTTFPFASPLRDDSAFSLV